MGIVKEHFGFTSKGRGKRLYASECQWYGGEGPGLRSNASESVSSYGGWK